MSVPRKPYQEKKVPIIEAYLGSVTQLKCQSSHKFTSCHFISPSGEKFSIASGKSYKNKRIECLCAVSGCFINNPYFSVI